MAGNNNYNKMIKVKIRQKDRDKPPEQTTRRKLMEELNKINIEIYRIIDLRDGWVLCTAEDKQTILTTTQVTNALNKIGLQIALPREAQAKYTLVFKKLDPTIFEYDEQEIKQEFEDREPSTINKIAEIYKMQQHSIIKIKFNDMEIAEKIKKEGIKLFYCTLAPWQIENEKTANLIQCMKCYGYGHLTATCNKTVQICSECSSLSHTWKECDARMNPKLCTQCGGPHRTFSGLCLIRKAEIKKAMEEKARKEEENAIKPYVNVIQQSTSNAVQATQQATQQTFRDALKKNIEHTRGETRQMVEASQDTLLQRIEEIMDRKLNEMVKRIKSAIIETTRDEKTPTPKAITTTEEEAEEPEKGATRKRKMLRKRYEKGQETPMKRPTAGRFSLLQDNPIIAFPEAELIEEIEYTDIPKENKKEKGKKKDTGNNGNISSESYTDCNEGAKGPIIRDRRKKYPKKNLNEALNYDTDSIMKHISTSSDDYNETSKIETKKSTSSEASPEKSLEIQEQESQELESQESRENKYRAHLRKREENLKEIFEDFLEDTLSDMEKEYTRFKENTKKYNEKMTLKHQEYIENQDEYDEVELELHFANEEKYREIRTKYDILRRKEIEKRRERKKELDLQQESERILKRAEAEFRP